MQPLYRYDGGRYIPSEATGSPWSARGQHGGPPCALLARAIEEWAADLELRPIRLGVDLFRQVPMAPLALKVTPVRQGRRLVLVRVSLYGDDREVSQATALLLRPSETPALRLEDAATPGPDGLETESLLPEERRRDALPGFHTEVEVRWVRRQGPRPAAWIRVPMPLVEGEEMTPFQRVAAISDFGNALASAAARELRGPGAAFINTDTTVYLSRLPAGDWICLEVDQIVEDRGVGVVEVSQRDAEGRFARSVQARLVQPTYPHSYGDE